MTSQPLILVGPTPPPTFGVATLTPILLEALADRGILAAHLDTRDPRPLDRLAHLDLENLRLGIVHSARLARMLRAHPGAGLLLPISQGRWGFLRDSLWVGMALAARRHVYLHVNGGRMGEFHAGSSAPMRRLIRETLQRATGVWVLTPSLRPMLAGIVSPARLGLLPNAVADPQAANGKGEGKPDGFRILFLSNLREGKGHRELVEALAIVGARANDWTVRLVGEVPAETRAELLEAVASHAPGVRLEIPGSLVGEEKANELAAADVFVLPTSFPNEGQPLAVLEAMATGLPVISTRYRGLPDTIEDGTEGILLESPEPSAIAAALLDLHADPARRRRLGAAARLRWERDFSPAPFGERLAKLLDR